MEKLYFHREETLFSTGETLLDRVLVVKCCPQIEEEPNKISLFLLREGIVYSQSSYRTRY